MDAAQIVRTAASPKLRGPVPMPRLETNEQWAELLSELVHLGAFLLRWKTHVFTRSGMDDEDAMDRVIEIFRQYRSGNLEPAVAPVIGETAYFLSSLDDLLADLPEPPSS